MNVLTQKSHKRATLNFFSLFVFLADGVCGCFNQDKDGLKADTDSSINLAEILAEESKFQVCRYFLKLQWKALTYLNQSECLDFVTSFFFWLW